jgi:hypothetical protein
MDEYKDVEARLEEIEARVGAATPGPWWNETHVVHAKHPTEWTEDNHSCVHPATCYFYVDDSHMTFEQVIDNAEFIAHARIDLPALLAVVLQVVAISSSVGRCQICFGAWLNHLDGCPLAALGAPSP